MIISKVTCKIFGETTTELRDISELFTGYGDVFRKTFNLTDIAMNRAFNLALQQSKQNGIYGYPNPHAVNLEKMAGFKENSLYVRNVSLVFLNFVFLLPIQIYGGKIHNYWNFYKRKVIRSNVKLLPTRLTIFNFRIFKKAHNVNAGDSNIKIGFLYEFLPSEGFGDTFLVFGDKYFDVSKIGFEFCDNSA